MCNLPLIGIDFGTSYSMISSFNRETKKPELIKYGDSENIPTLISCSVDQNRQISYKFGIDSSTNTIFDIKRMIGVPYNSNNLEKIHHFWKEEGMKLQPIFDESNKNRESCNVNICVNNTDNINDQIWETSENIVGNYLKWLIKDVAGIDISIKQKVVITIPSDFTTNQRKAILKAGEIAGLKRDNITLLHEPSASALTYLQLEENKNKSFENLLVCDFGGGTFDLSLLAVSQTSFDVKYVSGDRYLGGRDFDQKIYQWFCDTYQKDGIKISQNDKVKIIKQCQEAKEKLSFENEAEIQIENKKIVLTREMFNSYCCDLIERIKSVINQTLNEYEISVNDIDGVLLVGGSSQIPIFQEEIMKIFGREKILEFYYKKESIAIGACYLAAINDGTLKTKNRKKNYNQRLAHSIGIESLEIDTKESYLSKILLKNSAVPCQGYGHFTNVYDTDRMIYLIYEGDGYHVTDDGFIGSLDQNNLPFTPANQMKITITMSIDENGILETKGFVEGSGEVYLKSDLAIKCKIFNDILELSQINSSYPVEFRKNEKDCEEHLRWLTTARMKLLQINK
ncbi:hypothetical protein M9Y10_035075 [Tritrichomonas musculus]|uniref:DnaK protein n=1 Tax=Tritrichomonas musculus TaxID=1915356 RepID=A0ABR2KGQ8_9EUKA